jgi:AcrR family transcriptional regulator
MPKQVDHDQRRDEIARAAVRVAAAQGLQRVSFREVAAEAGMSVALVQHYFGTKANLLGAMLDGCSTELGGRALQRISELGADQGPLDRISCIAAGFLPTDAGSRDAMSLYLSFAVAALTDRTLRGTQAFRDEEALRQLVADELTQAQSAGCLIDGIDPSTEARAVISMILGLSLSVLLDATTPADAVETVEAHLRAITRPGPR